MELARDPILFQAVREELMTAYKTDPVTQQRIVDAQTLVALPLLQSIYIEVMRLHVSVNITREVVGPIEVEGHRLEKGDLIQAPSEISHHNEDSWSAEGHPASEFWAERHIKYVETTNEVGEVRIVPQFTMAGRSNDFFPYGMLPRGPSKTSTNHSIIGGGVSMCPGRFFAKQEIMLTMGMLVSRFDIEFVEWTTPDGSISDRVAENDVRWAGAASVPPDRDMKVRWKRLW